MKFVLSILFIIALYACNNQEAGGEAASKLLKDTANFTNILWVDSLKNIGMVEAGKKTAITFHFKNTGTKPLFIVAAEPGCGCTVAAYPKEAIAPGRESAITAEYHVSSGTTGEFRKNIHITANTKGSTSQYIFFFGKIRAEGDTNLPKKSDPATIRAITSKEIKRNLLLKPTIN